jgi:ATP-dependent helicase/nuclease subunit B
MSNHSLMQCIENRDALFSALTGGAILITPNNRLSSQLLNDVFKQTQSTTSLGEVRCLPYQAFLRFLFKKARHEYPMQSHPLLLNAQQQRHVWRSILPKETSNEGLLTAIQDAWTRCQYWQIDPNHQAFAKTSQTQQFQQWQQQFLAKLQTLHAITEEQLVGYLLNYPDLFDAKQVIWVCFDDYTPQQQHLQQAMAAFGCQQAEYDLSFHPSSVYQFAAKDNTDEYLHMLEWAKERLAAQEKRIAVVVPDLQMQSKYLQRLLQQQLPVEQFNISLGQPLIEYPLVAHALHWLRLDSGMLEQHQARLLLQSPYLVGSESEFIARADVLQENRMLQEALIPMPIFIKTLTADTPVLAGMLQNLSTYPSTASLAEWVNQFKQRLVDLGFPGEGSLNSVAYQYFQRLMLLFDEFLQLAVINPIMSKNEALAALSDMAKSTIFQTQKTTTPLQILGLLEASGCTFDSVWVCGLTDQCLPQKTNLSAFIHIHLQRELQMPHALVERELHFAEQLLKRLQYGSTRCVLSYPKLSKDMPNLPSPLIKHFPAMLAPPLPSFSLTSQLVSEDEAYVLAFREDEPVSGGTTLLANQAQCPFRAFATHRLYATSALASTIGLDASERGILIHKILDLFWQRIGSQQRLLALTPDQLQQHIKEVILTALTPLTREGRPSFSPLIQDVELARLERLLNASLEWEKKRPPFIVEATEQNFTIQLSGIDFRVRVDRLDKVGDNKWVIDYKSSLPLATPWNKERPEAPQLLLYALLDNNINTLLFLQLKGGRLMCSGLSEEDVMIEGIKALKEDERWLDWRQEWQQQLTLLAQEFEAGYCAPIPQRASACQQCEFPNLCRIN